MTGPSAALADLTRRRAEWTPWLAVIAEVVREIGSGAWDTAIPPSRAASGAPGDTVVPRLAGTTITLPTHAVRRYLDRLIRAAENGGTLKIASVRQALGPAVDPVSLFEAAIAQNADALGALAAAAGSDPEALQAVASLVCVPFLHAAARRVEDSVSPSWVQGYCPVCGAWPAFAEIRGIERTRAFRCGRCAAAWHSRALCCPYCDTSDHDDLVGLVPQEADQNATVEGCNRCRGYIKAFTRLQGCAPEAVMIEDLASVALDVAALHLDYSRPAGAGYALGVRVQ